MGGRSLYSGFFFSVSFILLQFIKTVLFLLGLLGMMFERRTAPLALFFIQVVYMVSVIIFYVFARYRMVAVPLFCLPAGYGLFMMKRMDGIIRVSCLPVC